MNISRDQPLNRDVPATGSPPAPPSLAESRAYCAQLARRHYENFTVASWLLPRKLRPHFYHIYAYCRTADDLADEIGDPARSLQLLDDWQRQLLDCHAGQARHPVFVALHETIAEFGIPEQPFLDLLTAFRQDQRVSHYETFDELLGYCRNSANPVGRLVLYLGRCHDEEHAALSDQVCTGLQLVNFWQDVARDYDIGRIYLPQETLRQFDCDERPWRNRRATPEFRAALAFEVDRAEGYLRRGLPLVKLVPAFLAADIQLFIDGGLAIARHVRRLDYDVWSQRPRVGRWEQVALLARYLTRRYLGGRGPAG